MKNNIYNSRQELAVFLSFRKIYHGLENIVCSPYISTSKKVDSGLARRMRTY